MTAREHAFAFWLAEQLDFPTGSAMIQVFLATAKHLFDCAPKASGSGRVSVTIAVNGRSAPLAPWKKLSFTKREIVKHTEKLLLLRDGRAWRIERSLDQIRYTPIRWED